MYIEKCIVHMYSPSYLLNVVVSRRNKCIKKYYLIEKKEKNNVFFIVVAGIWKWIKVTLYIGFRTFKKKWRSQVF